MGGPGSGYRRGTKLQRDLRMTRGALGPDFPVPPNENAATFSANDARTGDPLGAFIDGVERFTFPISSFSKSWMLEQWGPRAYSVGFAAADGARRGRTRFVLGGGDPVLQAAKEASEAPPTSTTAASSLGGIDRELAVLEKVKAIVNAEASQQLSAQREFIAGQNQLFREMVAAVTGQAQIAVQRPAIPEEVVNGFRQIGEVLQEIRAEQLRLREELAGGEEEEEGEDDEEEGGEAVIAVAKHLGVPTAIVAPYAAQIEAVGKVGFLKLFSWIQQQPPPGVAPEASQTPKPS